MSLPDFIDDFLGKRGPEGPDGRRLFEYECQDWECGELREELRGLGDPLHTFGNRRPAMGKWWETNPIGVRKP